MRSMLGAFRVSRVMYPGADNVTRGHTTVVVSPSTGAPEIVSIACPVKEAGAGGVTGADGRVGDSEPQAPTSASSTTMPPRGICFMNSVCNCLIVIGACDGNTRIGERLVQ